MNQQKRLTLRDFQNLNSKDAVVTLFEKLGYPNLTLVSVPPVELFGQTHQYDVRDVWRLAQYRQRLSIYLIESTTLSNSTIDPICRRFARLQGEAFLIFTEDYTAFKFVNLKGTSETCNSPHSPAPRPRSWPDRLWGTAGGNALWEYANGASFCYTGTRAAHTTTFG